MSLPLDAVEDEALRSVILFFVFVYDAQGDHVENEGDDEEHQPERKGREVLHVQ